MGEDKKFRIYPTRDLIKPLFQWIGHQRFIYNSKVQEVRSDASASNPMERVSDVSAHKADMQFSLKQETPTKTAATV